MSKGTIKPKRMKRPKLPEKCTLMDCVRWVMYSQRVDETEAKRQVAEAINSGKLPFAATLKRPGTPDKHGVFRVRDGRFVEEH